MNLIHFIETSPGHMMMCTNDNLPRFQMEIKRRVSRMLDAKTAGSIFKLGHIEKSVKIKRILDGIEKI